MKKFCVLVHASDVLLLNSSGHTAPGGAYTWRIVEAENPKKAGEIAKAKLLGDENFLSEIWNTEQNPPKVVVDEINRLRSKEARDSGLVFYFEDEEDEAYLGETSTDH